MKIKIDNEGRRRVINGDQGLHPVCISVHQECVTVALWRVSRVFALLDRILAQALLEKSQMIARSLFREDCVSQCGKFAVPSVM